MCASGSHVWNGNSGTLTANPTANAQNSHFAVAPPTFAEAQSVSVRTSNVSTWPGSRAYRYATLRMPTNRNAEPVIVNKKNFVAA